MKNNVEKNFKAEFKSLLEKYSAEFDVLAKMSEWGAMIEGIEIYIPEKYDENGDLVREETKIELTKWFNADCL